MIVHKRICKVCGYENSLNIIYNLLFGFSHKTNNKGFYRFKLECKSCGIWDEFSLRIENIKRKDMR